MVNKKKLLWILWVIFAVIIVWLIIWRLAPKAHATHCDCNYHTPTPTVEPSILPSVLPSVSPCQGNIDSKDEWIQDCITPTITPTPTAGESATPIPQNNGGGGTGGTTPANAAGPMVCTIPFDKPLLFGFKLGQKSGDVTYIWFDAQSVDKFSIVYGYDVNNLIYGEDNIPGDIGPVRSITLSGLQPGRNTWAEIYAWRGGCAEISNPFDPLVL